VPKVVGLRVAKARQKLVKLKLAPAVQAAKGKAGVVVRQRPRAGAAAAPGLRVTLTVGTRG
jgi:beta-lactam-binding protein with PASTA domain